MSKWGACPSCGCKEDQIERTGPDDEMPQWTCPKCDYDWEGASYE